MTWVALAGAALAGFLTATAACAQGGSVATTSTPALGQTPIEQGGVKAAAIRRSLEAIRLPPGFRIGLYAVVPDARVVAVAPQGGVTFVSTRGSKVYAVVDRGGTDTADVREFAPSLRFTMPHGLCFSKDGVLFVAEQNRVLAFPAAGNIGERKQIEVAPVVPQDGLIPIAEQSSNHSARVCRVGLDNKLYVALGQPYNVPPPGKLDLYNRWGIGGIVRMDRDGGHREVFASGIRNSVGMDFAPDGALWFTDNQVDGMGDDIPPGEINRATRAGQFFGFPWYGGGHTRTVAYRDQQPPADAVFPVVEEVAHAADLGMVFYTGTMFPKEYRGAVFSAQHGSWNRSTPIGARVMVTKVAAGATAPEGSTPFAEGWIDPDGEYAGRPVDVAQAHDGSLLVSDDLLGAVYRITYDRAP